MNIPINPQDLLYTNNFMLISGNRFSPKNNDYNNSYYSFILLINNIFYNLYFYIIYKKNYIKCI